MTIYRNIVYVHFIKMFVCQVVLGLLRLSQWLLCRHLDYQWKFKGLWKGSGNTIFNFC